MAAQVSRFQVIEQPMALPGQCMCGSPNGPFVDFGMLIDFYGAVMLCKNCVVDMAHQLGMIFPVAGSLDVAVIKNQLARVANNVSDLSLVSDAIDSLVDSFVVLRSFLVETSSDEATFEPVPADPIDAGTTGQESSDAASEGSDGVPSDSGDESDFATGKPSDFSF